MAHSKKFNRSNKANKRRMNKTKNKKKRTKNKSNKRNMLRKKFSLKKQKKKNKNLRGGSLQSGNTELTGPMGLKGAKVSPEKMISPPLSPLPQSSPLSPLSPLSPIFRLNNHELKEIRKLGHPFNKASDESLQQLALLATPQSKREMNQYAKNTLGRHRKASKNELLGTRGLHRRQTSSPL